MLIGAMGIVTAGAAKSENNSSLTHLVPQQTHIVLAQAASPATPQPDYILKSCEETVSGVTAVIRARSFSPAATLADYLGNKNNRDIQGNPTAFASIKTNLLEDTKHGKMTTQTDDAGLTHYYVYTAIPNYEGKDKAVFMAEFEGKRYKIILELHVFAVAPMENQSVNSCPPPKLIKVNGKPVSGSSGYDFGSVSVSFADLPAGALGQTTGSSITLDTTAAGNGWYIDTTDSNRLIASTQTV